MIPSPADIPQDKLDKLVFPAGSIPFSRQRYFAVKSKIESWMAGFLLVVSSPLLLLLMGLVRLTSRGPSLYVQRRTGAGGKTFKMYKLRSMVQNAEDQSGKVWSQPGDRRVTLFGRFLRFSHLDELPQLYNVWRGEMSLIGPRPERPEFVQVLTPLVEHYHRRHAIRPGITGLAQIYLPPDENLESVKKKVAYDLMYLQEADFKMDVRIALCTAIRILGIRRGIGPRWTGLTRSILAIQAEKAEARRQREARQNRRVPSWSAEKQKQEWAGAAVANKSPRPSSRGASELAACISDSSISFVFSEFETPSGSNLAHRAK